MMRQAIKVKFLAPTNRRGPRYKATASAGTVTNNRDYSLSDAQDARRAAEDVAKKFSWPGKLIVGGLGHEYVFVFLPGKGEK